MSECHFLYCSGTVLSVLFRPLLPPPKEVMFSLWSVCLSVRRITEKVWTNFDEISWRVGHGPETNEFNFGDDPDHRLDPGVRSPKSAFTGLSIILAFGSGLCFLSTFSCYCYHVCNCMCLCRFFSAVDCVRNSCLWHQCLRWFWWRMRWSSFSGCYCTSTPSVHHCWLVCASVYTCMLHYCSFYLHQIWSFVLITANSF